MLDYLVFLPRLGISDTPERLLEESLMEIAPRSGDANKVCCPPQQLKLRFRAADLRKEMTK
jgi:hypothetical protein